MSDDLVIRMQTKREALVADRDQLRLQLNGVENQIYLIDQLLAPTQEALPESASDDHTI